MYCTVRARELWRQSSAALLCASARRSVVARHGRDGESIRARARRERWQHHGRVWQAARRVNGCLSSKPSVEHAVNKAAEQRGPDTAQEFIGVELCSSQSALDGCGVQLETADMAHTSLAFLREQSLSYMHACD